MKKNKQGFTLLEVVLVLAMASLIFLAMAITIPNLVRNQKDTDRRAQFGQLLSKITLYQANNRKALPEISASTNPDGTPIEKIFLSWNETQQKYENAIGGSSEWLEFVNDQKYLPESFHDPDGKQYNISITTCNTSVGTGNICNSTEYFQSATERKTIQDFFNASFPNDHLVLVVINARCYTADKLIATSGKRVVSVLYKYENGGTYCENN